MVTLENRHSKPIWVGVYKFKPNQKLTITDEEYYAEKDFQKALLGQDLKLVTAPSISTNSWIAGRAYYPSELVIANDRWYRCIVYQPPRATFPDPITKNAVVVFWKQLHSTSGELIFDPPYVGTHPPDFGDNIIQEGHARIWENTFTDEKLLVTKINGRFSYVELS